MSNPPLMSIKPGRLRCEYSCLGGPMVKVRRGSRVPVGAIAVLVAAGSVVTAAPLLPATMSMGSEAVADVTPVQWRGRDGGAGVAAGLATGPIIGGQLGAPRYYEPNPDYLDDYPPRYGGPIGYGSPDWEAYCFSRYRSFDPISGTYQGRDGRRHYCQ